MVERRGRAVLYVQYRDDEPDAEPEAVDLHITTAAAATMAASRLMSHSSDIINIDVDFQPFATSVVKAS
jgi:hypothetical protein